MARSNPRARSSDIASSLAAPPWFRHGPPMRAVVHRGRQLVAGLCEACGVGAITRQVGPADLSLPHGDWGGARSALVDEGVTFDLRYTSTYQGLASGTGD